MGTSRSLTGSGHTRVIHILPRGQHLLCLSRDLSCCGYLQIPTYALLFHLSLFTTPPCYVYSFPLSDLGFFIMTFNLHMSSTQHEIIRVMSVRFSRTDPEQVLWARKVRRPGGSFAVCVCVGGVWGVVGGRDPFIETLDLLQKPRTGKQA